MLSPLAANACNIHYSQPTSEPSPPSSPTASAKRPTLALLLPLHLRCVHHGCVHGSPRQPLSAQPRSLRNLRAFHRLSRSPCCFLKLVHRSVRFTFSPRLLTALPSHGKKMSAPGSSRRRRSGSIVIRRPSRSKSIGSSLHFYILPRSGHAATFYSRPIASTVPSITVPIETNPSCW